MSQAGAAQLPSEGEVAQLVTTLCTGSKGQRQQAVKRLFSITWCKAGTAEVDAWIERLIQRMLGTSDAIPALASMFLESSTDDTPLLLLINLCSLSPASTSLRSRISAQHPSIITSLLALAVSASSHVTRQNAVDGLKALSYSPSNGRLIAQEAGIETLVHLLGNDEYSNVRHAACDALAVLMGDSYKRCKKAAAAGVVQSIVLMARLAGQSGLPDIQVSALYALNNMLVHLSPNEMPSQDAQLIYDVALELLRQGLNRKVKETAVGLLASLNIKGRAWYLQRTLESGALLDAVAAASTGSKDCKHSAVLLMWQCFDVCSSQRWQAAAAAGALDVAIAVLLAPRDSLHARAAAVVLADIADVALPMVKAAAAAAEGVMAALVALLQAETTPDVRTVLLRCLVHLLSQPFKPALAQQALAAGAAELSYQLMSSTEMLIKKGAVTLVNNLLVATTGPGRQVHPRLRGVEEEVQALVQQPGVLPTLASSALVALGNVAAVAPASRPSAARSLSIAVDWQGKAARAGADEAAAHQRAQYFAARLQAIITADAPAGQAVDSTGRQFELFSLACHVSGDSRPEARVAAGAAAEASEEAGRVCAACGAQRQGSGRALMQCSRCKGEYYCSAACQKGHWKVHKRACNKLGDVQVQAGAGGNVITLSR